MRLPTISATNGIDAVDLKVDRRLQELGRIRVRSSLRVLPVMAAS
jgi:hypothetical protein